MKPARHGTLFARVRALATALGAALLASALCSAPIRVGVDRASPPLSFVGPDSRPDGFSVELLQALSRVTGLQIEIVQDYWAPLTEAFEAGRLDVLANVRFTPEREARFDFSVSHAQLMGVCYYRRGAPGYRRAADFAGARLGVVVNTMVHDRARSEAGWGARLLTYELLPLALAALRRGECDVVLGSNRSSEAEVSLEGLKRDFVQDVVFPMHFGLHRGDRATLAKLNQGLALLMRSGEFDRIYRKWIGPIEPRPLLTDDLKPYLLPAVAVLAALAAVFWWQRRMMARLAAQAESLHRSEERWSFALQGSGAAVWDFDVASGRVQLSEAWTQLLGYAPGEIGERAEDVIALVHPEDRPRLMAARTRHLEALSSPFAVEQRMRCRDGAWKWVLNRGMVVRRGPDGTAQRMIGTYTDLTASKQAETDRLVLGKLESTGVLAGGIAHDFNNLLAAQMLCIDLVLGGKLTPEKARMRLQDTRKATQAAQHLTQQLLTFSKGGAGAKEVVVLERLIRESAALALSGSSAGCDIAVEPALWPTEVDIGQIGQLLRNLILNAREAMEGAGTVTVVAVNTVLEAGEVGELPGGPYVRLSVGDHGSGIAPEVLPSIFDPYFSTKQRGAEKGVGLGLTICHSVARQHGGAITVESLPGTGTRFDVHLPARPAAITTPEMVAPPAPAPGPARLLVMDDEEMIRDSIRMLLEQAGYEVMTAADGQEAAELHLAARTKGQPFHAALLDLTVRGAPGGMEALRLLQEREPALRAIVMSGYSDSAALRQFAGHGFRAALAKPFDEATLLSTVATVLRGD